MLRSLYMLWFFLFYFTLGIGASLLIVIIIKIIVMKDNRWVWAESLNFDGYQTLES